VFRFRPDPCVSVRKEQKRAEVHFPFPFPRLAEGEAHKRFHAG
jgi:hypothetical protein